ncbi:MAG: hypothetical protein AAF995_11160 [Planctomycetota bacterium]
MSDIERVLRQASRRLMLTDWLRTLVVVLAGVIALLVLLRLTQKFVPMDIRWDLAFAGAGVFALGASALWTFIRRRKALAVARELDERGGLRESLSTALAVEQADDPWSKLIVRTAQERARRVVVRDVIPVRTPAAWPAALGAAVALAAVWWLPQRDVTGLFAQREAEQEREVEVQQARAEVEEAQEELRQALADAGLELELPGEDFSEGDQIDPTAPTSPEEIRRSAIKRLTNLADQLEDVTKSDEAAQVEAVRDAMRRLRTPSPGPASEMARAMAQGDFAKASQELDQLAQQLASGEMSEEQKQQLAEQAQQLKEQLEQLAENRQQLEEQLRAAGMSEAQAQQAARSPEAMQQALEQNENLSEEQKQQLQQAAQAQQQASDSMGAMSQAMGQMSQGAQAGSDSQAAEGMNSMGGQLSSLEQMQAEMGAASAAMNQVQQQLSKMQHSQCEGGNCSSGACSGMGEAKWGAYSFNAGQGNRMSQGSGSGNQPGQGMGPGPEEQAVDFLLNSEKASVTTTEGPIIASSFVFGSQIRGESTAQFGEIVGSAKVQAAEAIESKRVPREHENAVQHYFGRLEAAATEGAKQDAPAGD